jgi:hypothetical protein
VVVFGRTVAQRGTMLLRGRRIRLSTPVSIQMTPTPVAREIEVQSRGLGVGSISRATGVGVI